MEAERSTGLSSAAALRKRELLGDLLQAVRHRRRRRRLMQACSVAVVAGLLMVVWPRRTAPPQHSPDATPAVHATSFACEIVHDDPSVLDRYRVRVTPRDDWFIDDNELQLLLRTDARPDGLIRIAGRVQVAPAAVDALPLAGLE